MGDNFAASGNMAEVQSGVGDTTAIDGNGALGFVEEPYMDRHMRTDMDGPWNPQQVGDLGIQTKQHPVGDHVPAVFPPGSPGSCAAWQGSDDGTCSNKQDSAQGKRKKKSSKNRDGKPGSETEVGGSFQGQW
jgi:hypothetical protein